MITWLLGKKEVPVPVEKKGDDFVSLSSHALRSPLSIIKWYTEMLLDGDAGPLTEEQHRYLTLIASSNQRAIDLVRSLLNVSRLELDTFSVSPGDVNPVEVVAQVVQPLKEVADKKHVTLLQEQHGDIPNISIDTHLVSMVLKILLGNAITFSKEGGEVHITLTRAEKDTEQEGGGTLLDNSILISIADSGIGIPEADKPKIFSKMFRAGNVKDTEGSDSGLGLYIVKTVLDKVGGQIWFFSEENVGTTFYVALPLKGMEKKEGKTTLD